MMESETNSLNPIAVLIDELKSDDIPRRVNSVKNLSTIAIALGQERTRKELLPYLTELMDDEEEVLIQLAQSLPQLFDHVGGRHHAHTLFEPLEHLCQVEDAKIRATAVTSYVQLYTRLACPLVEPVLVNSLTRLVRNTWYGAKLGAAQLIPALFAHVSAQQDLFQLYVGLVQNDHPQVREAAARGLTALVSDDSAQLLELIQQLVEDKEESVRLVVVQLLLDARKELGSHAEPALFSAMQALGDDTAWRVRQAVVCSLPALAQEFSLSESQEGLRMYLAKAFCDTETEVQVTACKQLFLVELTAEELVDRILPALADLPLATDAVLAPKLPQLCVVVGAEAARKYIEPVLAKFLVEGTSEVKAAVLQELGSLKTLFDLDTLTEFLQPPLERLAKDANWRNRLIVAAAMPSLVSGLGPEFFHKNLAELFITLLQDAAFVVRDKISLSVQTIGSEFGEQWTEVNLAPAVTALKSSRSYYKRIAAVAAATQLAQVVSKDYLNRTLAGFLEELLTDPVPNVRLNAAMALHSLRDLWREPNGICNQLRELSQDKDQDVREFVLQALAKPS